MRVIVYEDGYRDQKFYGYIGPFALDRNITKEMHDPQYGAIYDEDYAIWFILVDDKDKLLGFATLFDKEKEVFFDNCCVPKEQRGKGYGSYLFEYRLNYAKSIAGKRKIKGITKNDIQQHIYIKNGFKLASKRGKYYWMELVPE